MSAPRRLLQYCVARTTAMELTRVLLLQNHATTSISQYCLIIQMRRGSLCNARASAQHHHERTMLKPQKSFEVERSLSYTVPFSIRSISDSSLCPCNVHRSIFPSCWHSFQHLEHNARVLRYANYHERGRRSMFSNPAPFLPSLPRKRLSLVVCGAYPQAYGFYLLCLARKPC